MAALRVKGLHKQFGNTQVLKGIDLTVRNGEFAVLLGPSGCGKSTLLNLIAGLEAPNAGTIEIAERVVNAVPAKDRDIAMVFQSYALYPSMTVRRNITFGMECRGVPKPQQQEAVARVAALLQIDGLLERKPSQLSGGQRQRVAMGRALVRDPKLFLFDEPLSNLDAKLRVDMRIEIKRLHATTGKTIVYVTHDQIEAMTLATKIAVLKDGELQQVGTPAEIYNKPNNLFVADFMGSPAMNLIKATAASENGREVLKLVNGGGQGITLGIPTTIAANALAPGREVILGIRPEAITDRDGADRHSRAIEVVDCKVEIVEPAGADTFVVTHLGGKEVTARMRADADVRPGAVMPFAFNLDKAVVFDPASGRRL